MQIVDNCPVSEKEWKEAAAIKNCAAYASQCAEPERLVYHCVINPYVNQTLEVCAYAQNIVSGIVLFSLYFHYIVWFCGQLHHCPTSSETEIKKM